MNRRGFLKSAAAGMAISAAGSSSAQAGLRKLPLLPLVDLVDGFENRLALNLTKGTHDFGNGASSQTLGINGGFLGPALRVKQGQTLPFDIKNGIGEVTTLHWHGLHIPGDVDGGPHQEIEPDATWSPDLQIKQRASMNWFHSHAHGRTARQTYRGLAGVMLIEDDASLSADLPKTYGVDDFTLILQDKAFAASGQLEYSVSGEVFEDGFEGDSFVVNGAIVPVGQQVPKGLVRLRILNACNARFLELSLATGPLTVIASDGGFLGRSVETESILMSPGERYEVLLDMTALESNALQVNMNGGGGFFENLFGGNRNVTAIEFMRSDQTGFDGALPNALANMDAPDRSQASVTRSFELQMDTGADLAALALAWGNVCGGGAMSINGMPMNMDRIDVKVRKGDTEIWRISADDMLHPFHVHGCSFRILSQQGAAPPAYASGWKDMVHVEDGWSEILVRFDYEATETAPYMYHCHILEHEDCGMMGQFTVT